MAAPDGEFTLADMVNLHSRQNTWLFQHVCMLMDNVQANAAQAMRGVRCVLPPRTSALPDRSDVTVAIDLTLKLIEQCEYSSFVGHSLQLV